MARTGYFHASENATRSSLAAFLPILPLTGNVLPMANQGAAIKAMREAAGLSLAQLAERAECDESYLWRIEVGERRGSKYFLAHLAAVLGEVKAS